MKKYYYLEGLTLDGDSFRSLPYSTLSEARKYAKKLMLNGKFAGTAILANNASNKDFDSPKNILIKDSSGGFHDRWDIQAQYHKSR